MRKFLTLTTAAGLIAVCIVATGAGQGDIYRWKDVNGNWHYSDQPTPGAELVRGNRRPPPSTPPATPAPAAKPVANAAAATKPDPKTVDQVREDVATAQDENCKKADETYNKSVQARRMYKIDAQGVKTFLTAAELDEARLNARTQRDAVCKP
ncbi:MAG: DUF4124 domain-containing protein [Pseudomonadota bacterium]